jgi:hypothetical protein
MYGSNPTTVLDLIYESDVASTQGNEFVLLIRYAAIFSAGGEEVHLSLTDWELTFRDIFGIPINLPGVGDTPIGAGFDLSFLLQGFRDMVGAILGLGLLLGDIITSLTTILSDLTTIITALGNILIDTGGILADTAGILADTAQMVTDFASLLADTGGILADTTAIVLDIASIASDIGNLPTDFVSLLADTGSIIGDLGDILSALVDGLGDSLLGQILDELIAMALAVGAAIVAAIIAEAIALIEAIFNEILNWFYAIEVNGVTIGDVVTVIDSWMSNFWSVAAEVLDLSIDVLTNWTQVFLMGVLVGIMMWAAATSGRDGAVFLEKFSGAMLKNANPIDFVFNIYIPVGLILLGNVFWVALDSFDWNDFLVPAMVVMGL